MIIAHCQVYLSPNRHFNMMVIQRQFRLPWIPGEKVTSIDFNEDELGKIGRIVFARRTLGKIDIINPIIKFFI